MRKNFGAKPLTYPQPVFIIATYNEDGTANAMNAAWGGISCDEEIMICLAENHKTTENLRRNPDFTISMATKDYLEACDYLGIETGSKVANKLERCGLTTTKAEFVNAPLINELPLTIECTMTSYETEMCHLFAQIKNVSADETILTDGKVDPTKLKPLVFDPFNMTYLEASEAVGKAFNAGLKFK